MCVLSPASQHVLIFLQSSYDLTREIFFGPGESKSVCIQDDLLFTSHIVCDCLLVVLIMDCYCSLLLGYGMTSFGYIPTRKTLLFNLFMTMALNCLCFGRLMVGTALFHWL